MTNDNLRNIIIFLNSDILYEQWLQTITDSFKNTDIFYIQNSLINSFEKISEELWFDKISENTKIDFVDFILERAHPNLQFCSSSARNLLTKFHIKYPKLISFFIDELLKNPNSKYYDNQYSNIIISYISEDNKKIEYTEMIEKYNQNKGATSFTNLS